MKVLVTGGAGFIGSNLVDELIRLGHDVTVIDNQYSECHEKFYWNPKARNIFADIRNYHLTKKYYENIDWVFHCAAEARIQPAINEAIKAVDINIVGTTVVLQCALEAKVQKVIYSSSSSIYGTNIPPNSEIQKDKCLNVYSLSKSFGEKLCQIYYNLYNLQTISLRYFNVYGPNQPTKGEYAPVIGLWLKQRAENKCLTIVGDGTQKRSFTHVADVVSANILAASVDLKTYGEVINIGNESNYTILQIAKSISDQIEFLPPRIGESHEIKADCYKASKLLGWRAEIDLLEYLSGT